MNMVEHDLPDHTDDVTSVAWSDRGDMLASGSSDQTIRLWTSGDRMSPGAYGCIRTAAPVSSVAWGGGDVVVGGAMLCAASADHTLRLWRVRQRDHVLHSTLQGHDAPVSACAFNYRQTRIVSGSHDHTVRVWGWAEGARQLASLEGHMGWVTHVACGHEGDTAASSSRDGTIRVWDIGSASQVLELMGHTLWVTSCAFVPQQTGLVVSGGHDKTLRLWDVRSGMEVACLRGHTASVSGVCAGSHNLASSSWDGAAIVWSLRQRSEVHRVALGGGGLSRGGTGLGAYRGLCCALNDHAGGNLAAGVSGGSLRVVQPASSMWEGPPVTEEQATRAAGGAEEAEEWLVEALLQHIASRDVQGQVLDAIDQKCVYWAPDSSAKPGMAAARQRAHEAYGDVVLNVIEQLRESMGVQPKSVANAVTILSRRKGEAVKK